MSVRQSLSAALRLTSDIWFREHGRIQMYPAAALRIVDHHLHASGVIPRLPTMKTKNGNTTTTTTTTTTTNGNQRRHERMYEHDWLCISQSVTCLPMDNTLVSLCLDSEWSTFSHLWVDSVGNASINLGNLITMDSHVLATCRRVFVRKDTDGKSAPFSQPERFRFEKECSMDATVAEILSLDTTGAYALPLLERFGTFMPKAKPNEESCCVKVTVGPQHVNVGNHADNAFLVDVAMHAMMQSKLPVESLCIQYVAEARLGHELECYCHDDRVFITRTLKETGKPVLVAIAKGTTNEEAGQKLQQ